MKYVADDGKEFKNEKDCREYEEKFGLKAIYEKNFINGDLSKRVNMVREKFTRFCHLKELSDDYLEKNECKTRYETRVAVEVNYGIVYLRDDAVRILLEYISELNCEYNKLLDEAGDY